MNGQIENMPENWGEITSSQRVATVGCEGLLMGLVEGVSELPVHHHWGALDFVGVHTQRGRGELPALGSCDSYGFRV